MPLSMLTGRNGVTVDWYATTNSGWLQIGGEVSFS